MVVVEVEVVVQCIRGGGGGVARECSFVVVVVVVVVASFNHAGSTHARGNLVHEEQWMKT